MSSLAAVAARLRGLRAERGDAAACVTFAIDTELLGHWWSEGPVWLAAVLAARAGSAGSACVTLPAGARSATSRRSARCAASTWGEGKDLRTWDSPAVADLAWARAAAGAAAAAGARRGGLARRGRASAPRASCSRVQASDWAFLDRRGQAGDYAYQRATDHARALLEAIDSRQPPDPRMRTLAPDLSLAPLLEP